MKFITTPNRLIKSGIAFWWQTDALSAGGESELDSLVITQLLMLDCAPGAGRGSQLLYPVQYNPVMLPDRIPLGKRGTALYLQVIQDLPSSLLQGSRAALLPASLQEQLSPSCCELCNSGVYNISALPVKTQTRAYNLSRLRIEAGSATVPAVLAR